MFQKYCCQVHGVLKLRRVYVPVRLIAQLPDVNVNRLVTVTSDACVQGCTIGPIANPFRQTDSDILRAPWLKGAAQGRHFQPVRDVQLIIRIIKCAFRYVSAAKCIPAVVGATIVGELPCGGILIVHVNGNSCYIRAHPSDRVIIHKELPGYSVRYCVTQEIIQIIDIRPKGLVLDVLVSIGVNHSYHIITTGVFKVQPLRCLRVLQRKIRVRYNDRFAIDLLIKLNTDNITKIQDAVSR